MNNKTELKWSAAASAPKLLLRGATILDLPPFYSLLEDFQDKFLDDFQEVNRAWAKSLIHSGQLIIIDALGYAVGAVWFSDQVEDLHATIHLLLRPPYIRQAFQQHLFEALLDKAFYLLKVRKIKAKCLHTETTAIKLLKRYKFKQNGLFRNETTRHGKLIDLFTFELHRKFWEKYRHEFWEKEKREKCNSGLTTHQF